MSRLTTPYVPEYVPFNAEFDCGHKLTIQVDVNDPWVMFEYENVLCPACELELANEQAELMREPADDDRDDLSLEARRELDAGTRLNEYLSSLLVSTEPMPF